MDKPKPPTVGEHYPALVPLAEMEFEAARNEYHLLLERQLRFDERIRLGALTLNAASLVALLAALGRTELIDAIGGLTAVRWVAGSFVAGAVCGVVAMRLEGAKMLERVASTIPRYASALRIRGTLLAPAVKEADDRLGQELAGSVPQVTVFSRSVWAERFLDLAGMFWLIGAAAVFVALVGPEFTELAQLARKLLLG